MQKKRKHHLRVPVFLEEKQIIEENAHKSGKSVANYLRTIGQGYTIRSVVDYSQVELLASIRADLGRLGGLFKMWCNTPDKETAEHDAEIIKLLNDINILQKKMLKIMDFIVKT